MGRIPEYRVFLSELSVNRVGVIVEFVGVGIEFEHIAMITPIFGPKAVNTPDGLLAEEPTCGPPDSISIR